MSELVLFLAKKWRPAEDWPAFLLLAGFLTMLLSLIGIETFYSGLTAGWGIVLASTIIAWIVVKRPNRWPWVVFLVVLSTITLLICAILPLPIWELAHGWQTYTQTLNQHWLLVLSDLNAALVGGRYTQPVIRSIVLGGAIGPLTAGFFWLVYRSEKPTLAFMLAGILAVMVQLALDPAADTYLSLFFTLGLAIVAAVVWQQVVRERSWSDNQTDYSEGMRLSNTMAGLILAATALAIGLAIPAIPYREIQEWVVDLVTFDRPGTAAGGGGGFPAAARGGSTGTSDESAGPSTLLPTSFLLDGSSELLETPLFAVQLRGVPPNPAAFHWQVGSFDVYSGLGWQRSEETSDQLAANEVWIPPASGEVVIEQTVTWLDTPLINAPIYGQLTAVNQPVNLYFRFEDDLVRFNSALPDSIPNYTATATNQTLNPQTLNAVTYDGLLESAFYERYTQLPDNITERVRVLARQLTAGAAGPYDQAVAIEQYLRGFEYNLDVGPPPPNREVVDYFLFELQQGYCDYYATAMVVLARSIGLPARLGIGYNHTESANDLLEREAAGLVITRAQAHSWAEIYFPDYGWIEFEPTAVFPTAGEVTLQPIDSDEILNPDGSQPAVPGLTDSRRLLILAAVGVAAAAATMLLWFRFGPPLPQTTWAGNWFGSSKKPAGSIWEQMREIARQSGFEGSKALTPREFLHAWRQMLNLGASFEETADAFVTLWERQQYGHGISSGEAQALDKLAAQLSRLIQDQLHHQQTINRSVD